MLTINEIIDTYGDDIKSLGYGRELLAKWLNENLDGRYTQHFARRLLDRLAEEAQEPEDLDWGITSNKIGILPSPEPADCTIEEKLRRSYGITDPTWVPVGIWGEPNNPRAKWEKRSFVPEPEKLQAVVEKSQGEHLISSIELGRGAGYFDLDSEYKGTIVGVLSIRDTHFGMFTSHPWPYDSYDLKGAQQAYVEAAQYLMFWAEHMGVEQLVIPFGSDTLHVDGATNATTKGTPQDVTGPWWEAFEAAMESLNRTIYSATNSFDTVTLVLENGNHDRNMARALAVALRGKWGSEVSIIDGPESVKRVSVGNTHLFFNHGDSMKIEAFPALIHADHPDVIKQDSYVEVLTGHMHHRRRTLLQSAGDYFEPDALVHRITPALCPSSDWAEVHGYRSMPGAQLTVYDEEGFVALFDWVPSRMKAE